MSRIRTIYELKEWRNKQRLARNVLGLVPTMGALHQGHLNLVKAALRECDAAIVSIFVNPTQFAQHEDLDQYPRVEATDISLLRSLNSQKPLAIFCPASSEIYPRNPSTTVSVPGVSTVFEGAIRPHFFGGVATVVTKLLALCAPERLYMGQKDGQQCVVVKNLVQDLLFPTKLVIAPTVRESDGLAMSSRNIYLTDEERRSSVAISQALKKGCAVFASGICNREPIISAVKQVINSAEYMSLEYVGLVNEAMEEVDELNDSGAMLCVAVRTSVTNTRLIDNEFLGNFLSYCAEPAN